MDAYPEARWGDSRATFIPASLPLPAIAVRAALVFATASAGFLVADIRCRGWCIPSGRIEAGESSEMCARREAYEEAGAELGTLTLLGRYIIRPDTRTAYGADAFLARVQGIGPLPAGSESHGVRAATLGELPALYYRWDPLMEAVFRYADAEADFAGQT